MDTQNLKAFQAVAERGSFSAAAAQLHLTQPAVSVALANLEKELGFRLFHRAKGFFTPTAEALLLHAETELGLMAIERVASRAEEIRAGATGGISIASNGAAAINLLPWVIAGFQTERPGVKFDLKVRSSRQIANLVSGGQIDIGLIDAPVPVAGLRAEVFALPCVCIMPQDDPLAAEARVTAAMLASRSVIAVTGDHSIDRQVDQALSDQGLQAERRVSAAYFAIARNLVRAGAGIALVDSINGLSDLADGVTWRPFEPRIAFELAMIGSAHHPLETTAELFRTRLREELLAKSEI